MKRAAFIFAVIAVAFVSVNISKTTMAQAGQSSQQADTSAAQHYFTDVLLLNQDGREMKFYSDLIKGKVVVINPMFTSCNGVCPPMTRNMEKIQEWLGDRLGKDVNLISFTVDQINDTPPVLKEFSAKYHARPGWYFITGKKENHEIALKKLGQWVETREGHSNIILVGNDRTGLWKKAFGLAKPEDLIAVVESVLNDNPAQQKPAAK
jgi:cytochrome oxidase Cu insertion factor (SCO1/SenC/PrrC family)